jgi:membrane protein required for colicin V production
MALSVHDISTFDWIIAAILLVFLLRGLCIGFIRQLAASIALAGSWWAAGEYAGEFTPYLEDFISQPGLVFFLSFITIFLLSALFLTLIGQLLHKMLNINLLGWSDRLAGALLGLARGALTIVLLYIPVAALLPASHPVFAQALTLPYLNQGSELIRQFIQDERMNKALAPKPLEEPEQTDQDQPSIPVQTPPPVEEEQHESFPQFLPDQDHEDVEIPEEFLPNSTYQPSIPVQTPLPVEEEQDEPVIIPEWDSREMEQPEESGYLP